MRKEFERPITPEWDFIKIGIASGTHDVPVSIDPWMHQIMIGAGRPMSIETTEALIALLQAGIRLLKDRES